LAALETKNLTLAGELAEKVCKDFPKDAAAVALSHRIVEAHTAHPTADSAIWQLPGK
jgi:hypothetical protein